MKTAFALSLLLLIACTKADKDDISTSDTITASLGTVSQFGSSKKKVVLSHQFKSDTNYRFQIELNKETGIDSGMYSVLYKSDTVIDRQSLDLSHYRFVTNAIVKEIITDTGIDQADELFTIFFYKDNDE